MSREPLCSQFIPEDFDTLETFNEYMEACDCDLHHEDEWEGDR